MNYYSCNGIIGTYQGQEVYVIDYKDLTYEMSKEHSERLYAVRRPDRRMDIVENGMLVGVMTSGGKVDIFAPNRKQPYKFYQKKEETKPVDEVEDFSHYAEVVNRFFDGLEQLWAEIDASFMEQD